MTTMEKGADLGYSVAYRFQIRENISMLGESYDEDDPSNAVSFRSSLNSLFP